MITNKPFSQACENNKVPILKIISSYFSKGIVLEIGSGTGQHAVFFAEHLPDVIWQTSDQTEYHPGIEAWLAESNSENLGKPLSLDVNNPWPIDTAAGIFSANTAHIMDWQSVIKMFAGVGEILEAQGYFCLYGPVNINGDFTSESNQAFDHSLRSRNPNMGIRDLEDLQQLGQSNGLSFIKLHQMPANNVLMIWRKPEL